MTEFSKGPWRASRESWHTIDIRGADGDYIAEVMTYICGESDDADQDWDQINMQKANAQLLASAPGLLEALQACSKELRAMIDFHNVQSLDDGSYAYDYQTVFEADQAIAKALTPES